MTVSFPFGNPFSRTAKAAEPKEKNLDKLKPTSGIIPDLNDPANKKVTGAGDDPLLDFSKLWEPTVGADGKPVKKAGPKVFTPTIDPKAMVAMLDKQDFMKDASAEEMQAIAKGGEEAAIALGSVVNKASKRAFMMAFSGSNKMMEAAVQAARQDALNEVPTYVRDQMIDSELSRENILMANPAYKPMVDTIKRQYQDKFPKATPAEINKGVRAYFDKMVKDMNESTNKPDVPENTDLVKAGDPNADWAEWFELELPGLHEAGETPQNPNEAELPQT